MNFQIKNSKGENSFADIERLEKLVGLQLPRDYRDFLLRHNGGYPEPDGFQFKNSPDGSSVDRFLGLDVGEHSNIEKYLVTYRDRVPEGFFPIAHDPGGNLVLIGVKGKYTGKVFFWDHEDEADGYPPDMSNMHLVADSFSEFLRGLYEVEID